MRTDDNHSRTIRVLMFYDVEGWAWWHRIRNIAAAISPDVSIAMRRVGEPFDEAAFDFVVILEAAFYDLVRHAPREKIIIGSSCPKTLDETVRALERTGCAAGLVNNRAAWIEGRKRYRFYCCQNGVDQNLFRPSGPSRGGSACWVGNSRSVGNKGLDLIEEACRRADVPLLALDQTHNIHQRKVYTQEELRDAVYWKAGFYVCASECEGTPNPALEAMACGLPVVTTPVGNMPEIVEDGVNGFLAERSVEGLVRSMDRLKNTDLQAMGENARRSIENGWTWRHQAAKYEAMFKELLAEREHARAGKGEDASGGRGE